MIHRVLVECLLVQQLLVFTVIERLDSIVQSREKIREIDQHFQQRRRGKGKVEQNIEKELYSNHRTVTDHGSIVIIF